LVLFFHRGLKDSLHAFKLPNKWALSFNKRVNSGRGSADRYDEIARTNQLDSGGVITS
jgi:hypothetical protein